MPSFRFPLASAMAVVFLTCVGLAAISNPTEHWAAAVFTLAWVALLAGILGVLFRRGHSRATWVGFTLFGWAYLLVCIIPPLREGVRDRLLTGPLLRTADAMSNATNDRIDSLMIGKDPVVRWDIARRVMRDYDTTGDALMTLCFAVLGAVSGRSIAGRGTTVRDGGPVATGRNGS